MAAASEGSSGAVARAQGIMRSASPDLIVDGRWGRHTNETYDRLPASVKEQVDASLAGNGLTAAQLWSSHLQAKSANTEAYQQQKAEARLYREGVIAQQLEGSVDSTASGGQYRKGFDAPKHVVQDALRRASEATGEPYSLLDAFAYVESRHRSGASNGSSRGLMQMQPAAWKDASGVVPLPPYSQAVWDPYANALAGAAYIKVNRKYLQRLGYSDPVDAATLYVAHQQGAGGFMELWRAHKGLPPRSKYVSEEKMRKNPPPDKAGVTLDKGEFFRRWIAYVRQLVANRS